jgi:methyl-accepting chemotaxis protein
VKKFEIQLAIGAHGLWKQRLTSAIATGRSEFTPDKIRSDALCDFGKWLHSLPESERASEHWNKVHSLHERFHQESAAVLKAALAGRKEEASAAMARGSAFTLISMRLTAAMMEWMREF